MRAQLPQRRPSSASTAVGSSSPCSSPRTRSSAVTKRCWLPWPSAAHRSGASSPSRPPTLLALPSPQPPRDPGPPGQYGGRARGEFPGPFTGLVQAHDRRVSRAEPRAVRREPVPRGLGAGARVHLHACHGAALLSAATGRAARDRSVVHRHDHVGRRVRRGDQRHRRAAAARVRGGGRLLPEAVVAVRVHEPAARGAREGAPCASVLRYRGAAVRVPPCADRDGGRDGGGRPNLPRGPTYRPWHAPRPPGPPTRPPTGPVSGTPPKNCKSFSRS